jgi:hypothetical protein
MRALTLFDTAGKKMRDRDAVDLQKGFCTTAPKGKVLLREDEGV